ncbi:hypothetical protein CYMTET_5892 [Cymbomonas tetramitiformis]|uniref:Uncharacterized protein n=1 Tax=Cymbomonas tetramitiformis TaxID=36881 RepID=A0AAE0GYI5_9CHLO|nr:hypothetical protein CYMTET_5892 [Cymbomonas tetramitiformis]
MPASRPNGPSDADLPSLLAAKRPCHRGTMTVSCAMASSSRSLDWPSQYGATTVAPAPSCRSLWAASWSRDCPSQYGAATVAPAPSCRSLWAASWSRPKGNVDDGCWRKRCFTASELRALAEESATTGFAWDTSEQSEWAQVRKPGYLANDVGSRLTLRVDTSASHGTGGQREAKFWRDWCEDKEYAHRLRNHVNCQSYTASGGIENTTVTLAILKSYTASGGIENTTVTLAILKSYMHMGNAEITCLEGCSCQPATIDAHWEMRQSMTTMHALEVSRSPLCTLQIQVHSPIPRLACSRFHSLESAARMPLAMALWPAGLKMQATCLRCSQMRGDLCVVSSTSSGEHKFKVVGVSVGVDVLAYANQKMRPDEEALHMLFDTTDRIGGL